MLEGTAVVRCQRLSERARLPEKATLGSAGYDLYALDDVKLYGGDLPKLIGTGIALEIPLEYEGQIRSRSSMAAKGIIIPNSPGTIDSDYRGEVKVLLWNMGMRSYDIKAGDRIAQLVISPLVAPYRDMGDGSGPFLPYLMEVQSLSPTGRGSGGFGHTGV